MGQGVKRKYRELSSEPGQQGNIISIERFQAGKDAYRVAPTDEIAIPWPFNQHPTPDGSGAIENAIRDECLKICARHSINPRYIHVTALMRKSFAPTPDPVTYLVIDTRGTDTTQWPNAAFELRKLVRESRFGLPSGDFLKVEIRNEARMFADVSYPFPADKNLDEYLDDIEPKLVALVKANPSLKCTSIAYHVRGPRPDDENKTPPRPTVLIYVKPDTAFDFAEIETKFSLAMNSANFPGVTMHLDILPGTVEYAWQASDPKPLTTLKSTMPYNGVSIGASKLPRHTGSLGGWIRLTDKADPKKVTDCVMTAYHVIEEADADHVDDNHYSGIGFFGENPIPDIEVVWPSTQDEAETRSVCNKRIAEGSAILSVRTALSVLDQMKGPGRILGKVRWGSGHTERSPTNGRLDWALIPSPHTSQTNKPPNIVVEATGKFGGYEPGENDYVRKFGPDYLKKNDWVVRAGRTSTSHGYVNMRDRYVFWEDEKHKESTEAEIIGLSSNGDFCHAGDSGSWVVNQKYELVGMLVGQYPGNKENNGIVTPIKDLIADIEERTKCWVSLP